MDNAMRQALQNEPCLLERPRTNIATTYLLPMCIAQGPYAISTDFTVPDLVRLRYTILKQCGDTVIPRSPPRAMMNAIGQQYICYEYPTSKPFVKGHNNWMEDVGFLNEKGRRKKVHVATAVPWITMDALMQNSFGGYGLEPGEHTSQSQNQPVPDSHFSFDEAKLQTKRDDFVVPAKSSANERILDKSQNYFQALAPAVLFHLCLRFMCCMGNTRLQGLWIDPDDPTFCSTIHLATVRRQTCAGSSFVHTLIHTNLNDYHRYMLEMFLRRGQHWRDLHARLQHVQTNVFPTLTQFMTPKTKRMIMEMPRRLDTLLRLLMEDYGEWFTLLPQLEVSGLNSTPKLVEKRLLVEDHTDWVNLLPPELDLLPPHPTDDIKVLEQRLLKFLPKAREIKPPNLLAQFAPIKSGPKPSSLSIYHHTIEDTCAVVSELRYSIWHQDIDHALDLVNECPSGMLPDLCNQLAIICVSDIGVSNPPLVLTALTYLKNCASNMPRLLSVVKAMCLSKKSRLSHWMISLYGCDAGHRHLHAHNVLDRDLGNGNLVCTDLLKRQHPLSTQLCVDVTHQTSEALFTRLGCFFSQKVIRLIRWWHGRDRKPHHMILFLVLAYLTGIKVDTSAKLPPASRSSQQELDQKDQIEGAGIRFVPEDAELVWLRSPKIVNEALHIQLLHGPSLSDLSNLYQKQNP